jgi:hypothetical protein
MAFAKTPARRGLFLAARLEFFGAANKKGRFFFAGGGSTLCLVQERKAENEECL